MGKDVKGSGLVLIYGTLPLFAWRERGNTSIRIGEK
jgi:hypothetical protein